MSNNNIIVIKCGTSILTHPGGCELDEKQFAMFCADIAEVVELGFRCIIVSSAAIAAGVHALHLKKRPVLEAEKQACASIGQPILMRMYSDHLKAHGLLSSQILVSYYDLADPVRQSYTNITIKQLFQYKNPKIVPIINENDSVAVDELIKFNDNDALATKIAQITEAKLLILLTNVDGLIDKNNRRIPQIFDMKEAYTYVKSDVGEYSVGGMQSKLQAAHSAISHHIETVIAHGRRQGEVQAILKNEDRGTRFHPSFVKLL